MIKRTWRLGQIFGVSIRIDWSWLLIDLLITYNLAAFLGQLYPHWHTAALWLISSLAALCFFASVLAHELAHALVARANDIPVCDITLFFLGGAATLQREPHRPKAEFSTAIAGPLASLGLGVLMIILGRGALMAQSFFQTQSAVLSPLNTIFTWLGVVNILLAVLNMVPGFPLDGARVLRALLWGLTGSFNQATRWAAWLGQAIAWVIMAVGVSLLFGVNIPGLGTGLATGLWLIFIGWFLNVASAANYQQAALRQKLEGVMVVSLMRRDMPTAAPSWLVSDLALLLPRDADGDEFALPVLAGQLLVGIVTHQDLARLPRGAWSSTRVEEIMTSGAQLATIAPHEDASEAMEKLLQRDIRHLPVVRENCEFLGLLRQRDILRWLQLHQETSRV